MPRPSSLIDDAHATGFSSPGNVDGDGGCRRVGVTGDVRQALAHDGDDVVGEIGVDAPVEFVDDHQFVVQVGIDRAPVQGDDEGGRETQG